MFTVLLDIVIVNSYWISKLAAHQRGVPQNQLPEHANFCEQLFNQFFEFSSHPLIQTSCHRGSAKVSPIKSRIIGLHDWEHRPKMTGCMQYCMDMAEAKRLKSQKLPVNYIPHTDQSKRALMSKQGCKQCNVALCITQNC